MRDRREKLKGDGGSTDDLWLKMIVLRDKASVKRVLGRNNALLKKVV